MDHDPEGFAKSRMRDGANQRNVRHACLFFMEMRKDYEFLSCIFLPDSPHFCYSAPMTTKELIHKDLIDAMKAGNQDVMGTLRMLKAAVMKFETSGKEKKDASEEEVIQIVGKEIKSRKDSIEQFNAGNRPELAAKEEVEIKILEKYLPTQLSEEEVRAIVKEVITKTGATSKAELGKVMGALMPHVKGKADGGMVNKIVQEMLK